MPFSMTDFLNETHNPELRSWVGSANVAGCDFPIQNLPFASFKRSGSSEPMRIGVAIGTEILDLTAAAKTGVFRTRPPRLCKRRHSPR